MKIIALLLLTLTVPASGSVISNGSFEDQRSGFPAGWAGAIDPYGAWFALWEFGAMDGEYSVYCDAPDRFGIAWMWTDYDIPAGDYLLSAWANPINGNGDQAIYFDSGGDILAWSLPLGWSHLHKYIHFSVTTPLRIGAWNQFDDGLLLDDLRLEPVPEPWGALVVAIGLIYCMLAARREWRTRRLTTKSKLETPPDARAV